MNFSIVIPVHNGEHYLEPAIRSLQNQTVSDFELVVVNDDSTDKSLSIASQLAQNDSRITVFTKKKTALGDTRHKGIEASKGELIFFLDADDLAEPSRLEKQIDYMRGHPNCVASGGHVRFVDQWNNLLPHQPTQPLEHKAVEKQLLSGRGSAIWQTTLCMRRQAYEQVGGYDRTLNCSEDLDLYLRLSEFGALANMPEILATMRRHPCSISAIGKVEDANRRRLSILEKNYLNRGLDLAEINSIRDGHIPLSPSQWHAEMAGKFRYYNNKKAARKHSLRAVKLNPRSKQAWLQFARVFGDNKAVVFIWHLMKKFC